MYTIKELLPISKTLSALYVEDDIDIRNNYSKVFNEVFEHVDLAADGEEGLKKYEDRDYDIVITDINMPRMNGIAMIEKIIDKNPEQMIIVTSAHDESHYLMQLIDLGIEKFVIKPVDFKKLVTILYRTCKRLMEANELQSYQERIEEENLRTAALVAELKTKNEQLEKSIKHSTKKENVAIALVEGIESEKKFTEKELGFYSPKAETESARDFVDTFAGDIEVLSDRLEVIEETLELLIHQKLHEPTQESLEALSTSFCDYGLILAGLYKFNNLAEALENFGTILGQVEDLDLLCDMKNFLFGIADSLQKWRHEVLVEQTAADIHFLDNSIISDCVQTESMLSSSSEEGVEEALDDLFF